MINKLTDSDVALLTTVREEWIKIGLQTGPTPDRALVEEAIRDAYRVADLAIPQTIEWRDSPLAGMKRAKELASDANILNVVFGHHDADWLSFYDFFDRCESVQNVDISKIYPLMTIAKNAGWWIPYSDVCIVTERPIEIHQDAARRLHGENGMALKYKDGWGVYCWHGYRIPTSMQWIISDKSRLTPEQIESQSNAELRRIMLEIYGFSRYLENRKAVLISEDKDSLGNPRRLLELQVGGENIRIVEVTNSTPEPDGTYKLYHLGAMPGDNPHDVIAASFGFNPKFFREDIVA